MSHMFHLIYVGSDLSCQQKVEKKSETNDLCISADLFLKKQKVAEVQNISPFFYIPLYFNNMTLLSQYNRY